MKPIKSLGWSHIEPIPRKSESDDFHGVDARLTGAEIGFDYTPRNDRSFDDTITHRRTRTQLKAAKSEEYFSLVRDVFRIRLIDYASTRRKVKKTFPASGGLHVIFPVIWSDGGFSFYDDQKDAFFELNAQDYEAAKFEIDRIRESYSELDSAVVIFVGNRINIENFYENPYTLLLRDAGAVLHQFGLETEARGLSSRPIGMLCDQTINSVFGGDCFVGLGGSFVGATANG
ncbi:hypothetical protein [Roseovarius sp.]|uniref:hypothetical protein n=1 Tax=Roseovarius sp. TaxID=1486281 RepID=UPI003A978953